VREISVGRAGAREFLDHMRTAFPPLDGTSHPFRKRLELDARRADALFLPPPTTASVPLPPEMRGRKFRAALALDAGADSPAGVAFTIRGLHGEKEVASSRLELQARDFPFKAAWREVSCDLPADADRLVLESAPLSPAGQRDSLALFVCDPVLVPRVRKDERPNIVLISIDTLRRDHLSCYGYDRPTSPHLDQLAAEGMLFENAIAQCSYTLPSHVSMLSGQYPAVHGVRVVEDHITPKRTVLLSELLQQAGYRTAAFAGGLLVHSSYGYERGFDAYADRDPIMSLDGERLVMSYLDQALSAPFFLFVHTYAVHDFIATPRQLARFHPEPCDSRLHGKTYLDWGVVSNDQGATESDRRHIVDLYDAAIASTDEFVGRLLAELGALGLDQNTLVVVTSDHGKELLERGVLAHGHTLYDEMIRVPLLVRGPGVARGRASALVELVDITPTLLERAGLTVLDLMQGRSLFGSQREKSGTYSELVATPAFKHVWRTAAQKIIESMPLGQPAAARREVYDLVADPGERHDLGAGPFAPALTAELQRVQQALDRRGQELSRGLEKRTGVDDELLERLRAQGYIGK
jgi:arylsulfatase A-like enzyme